MRNKPSFPKRRKTKGPKPFYVRYVELEPSRVFNTLDPKNQNCWFSFNREWGDTWWEPETIAKREYYGECFKEEHDKITGHFSKLEQSIAAHGLKHPVLVVSGTWRDAQLKELLDIPPWFPPEIAANPGQALYVHTHGGSRFALAEKQGMEKIPCAVIDFAHMFNEAPEIWSGNIVEYFGKDYMWSSKNVKIINRRQPHLYGTAYSSMNQRTRQAQEAARLRATERTRERFGIPKPVDPPTE